jgi:hypothetical protein
MALLSGETKAKKPDNRFSPVNNPPITFIVDKGHRVHNYAKFFLAMSLKPKKDKKGCTSLDARWMKGQMSCTHCPHRRGMFKEFKKAITVGLKHHFINQDLCGELCKPNQGSDFQCKDKNQEEFVRFKKHHEEFREAGGVLEGPSPSKHHKSCGGLQEVIAKELDML